MLEGDANRSGERPPNHQEEHLNGCYIERSPIAQLF